MQVVPTYACGVDCWVWFSHVTAMGSTSIFQAWLLWKEGHSVRPIDWKIIIYHYGYYNTMAHQ
jgi:hypothetical protein